MTKRWLSLALVLTLLASVFPMGASAEGFVRKGLPVLTFIPANNTITAEAGGPDFSNKLLGEFRVDGSSDLSLADKAALSSGIKKSLLIYEETPSTNNLLVTIQLNDTKLFATLKSPTAVSGKAELPIRFADGLTLPGYVTTSLSGKLIAMVNVYTAVSTVKLDKTVHTFAGKAASKVLTATVNADGRTAADIEYVWSSSAPGIVKAEAVSGMPNQQKITPLAEGKATITVTASNEKGTASATCEVTVSKVDSTGVTISGFDENTTVGELVQLTAEIAGAANTDTVKSWSSSDEEVATIDEHGVLTAISEGITVITVTTAYGRTHAPSVRVYASTSKVSNPSYALSGDLSKPGATVKIATTTVGAKIYYTMTDNGAAPAALTAANAESVGTLFVNSIALTENKTYKFNAIAVKGTVACANQVSQKYTVDIAVTDFTLDKTAVTVNGKAEVVLTAKVVPANANVKRIDWTPGSGNANVSKVVPSLDGKTFKLTTSGVSDVTAEATLTYGNTPATKKASCKITVNQVPETGVSASPATLSIPAGRTAVLKAIVTPANATYEKANFYFNKDSAAIRVAGAVDGVVEDRDSITIEAKDAGEGKSETITLVTKNGLRATCMVTVTAASSKVAAPVFDVADGTVFTKTGASDRTVHLTSATKDAVFAYTINGAPGTGSSIVIPENSTAVVVAWATKSALQKSDTVTATFTSATAVTGVELGGTITIAGKGTHVLTATLNPATAKNKALTWKSNDATVATVAQKAGAGNELKAIITAVKPGTATISATSADGGYTASVTVTINPVEMDSVQIHDGNGDVSGATLTLNNGEVEQLTVKGFNGIDQVLPFGTPIWTSSDNTIATVSGTGRVVVPVGADSAKTANITVTLGGKTNTVTIQPGAKPAKVADLKFNVAGGTYTAEITVKAATATDGASVYYTLDGSEPKATSTPFPSAGINLSTKTTLRAVALKAALDPAYMQADYNFNIAVDEVKMEKTSLTLTKGATAQLKATVTPDNATNATIVWSVDPSSLATINSATGVLTAKGVGEATVTATVGAKTATCAVKITDVEATGIALAPSAATLTIGETKQLTALLQPSGLVGKTISWISSDEFVASISDDGLVTARKAGTAVITATVDGVKATATITVEAAPAIIPAEPRKEVTFAPAKEFKVIEGGSLSKVLGKLQPGDGETMDQIRCFCNIIFEKFNAPSLSAGAASPSFDVAKDGTVTLNIANVGDASTDFSYDWKLTAKSISGFTPSAALMNSGRTISGNKLNVVNKPKAIDFTENTVAAFEMKGSDKKDVVVGKINNYDDFVTTKVDVKATVSGVDKGATVAIAANGTVTVSVTGISKGVYTIVTTLTAVDCVSVKTAGFKVTVTQDSTPPEKKIVVSENTTKVIMSSYKNRPVYIVNLTDKNVTFSVPGYTVTSWKTNKSKLMSINASGVATLKKGGATRITVTAKLSDGTTVTQLVVIRKVATSLLLQYKSGKKWVTFGDTAVNLIKGKKLAVRVVAIPSKAVIFATQKWTGSNAAATYKNNFITGRSLGETTFQYVLDNGFVATAKVNVVSKGSKGVVELLEPAPTEPAPAEPAPTEPAPTEPAPTEPAPTKPAPTEPAPAEPAPAEPAPTVPVPTEPTPTVPVPTEPTPNEPAPAEPAPTVPASAEPAPNEPAPTEPAS